MLTIYNNNPTPTPFRWMHTWDLRYTGNRKRKQFWWYVWVSHAVQALWLRATSGSEVRGHSFPPHGCHTALACESPGTSGLRTQTWHWGPAGDSRTQRVPCGGGEASSSAGWNVFIHAHFRETSRRCLKIFYRAKSCWSGWDKTQCHPGH